MNAPSRGLIEMETVGVPVMARSTARSLLKSVATSAADMPGSDSPRSAETSVNVASPLFRHTSVRPWPSAVAAVNAPVASAAAARGTIRSTSPS